MEKIRPFDNNVESIYDWLTRFELKSELHGVDQSIMVKWAKVTIGRIGEVVLKDTTFNNWAEVKAHLERNLGTRDIAKRSVQELQTLQQKSDETIRQVGARATCLAKQAFPDTPENIQEREAVTAFIVSQPSHIKFELIKANCANISEVCTLAELLIEAHKQTGGTISAATTQAKSAEIEELQEEIKKMRLQLNKQNGRSTGKCFGCGESDHIQKYSKEEKRQGNAD